MGELSGLLTPGRVISRIDKECLVLIAGVYQFAIEKHHE